MNCLNQKCCIFSDPEVLTDALVDCEITPFLCINLVFPLKLFLDSSLIVVDNFFSKQFLPLDVKIILEGYVNYIGSFVIYRAVKVLQVFIEAFVVMVVVISFISFIFVHNTYTVIELSRIPNKMGPLSLFIIDKFQSVVYGMVFFQPMFCYC